MSLTIGQVLDELKTAKPAIASAIMAKGGTVSGGLSTFSADIMSIPQNGGEPQAGVQKDVNFYDYDGSFIVGYTFAEAQAMTALPAPPDHSADAVPLSFQAWNYTLDGVKSAVKTTDVGAIYTTTDGKTHLKLRVTSVSGGSITFYFLKTIGASNLIIDFGNGQTANNNSATSVSFTPATPFAPGEYDVTVWLEGSGTYRLGQGTAGTSCVGGSTQIQKSALLKVFIGNNCAIGAYGLSSHQSLTKVSMSNSCYPSNYMFQGCYSLETLVFPMSAIPATSPYACYQCYSLVSVFLPENITLIDVQSFYQCYALTRMLLPARLATLNYACFQGCFSLAAFEFTDKLTAIGTHIFQTCYSLRSMVFKANFPTVGIHLFYQCYGILEYDFSALTAIPTLSSIDAFGGISSACIIKVPAALYTAWQKATNWATYANYLVPV